MKPNEEIKQIRNKLKLSQKAIAKKIGGKCNRNIYADYELGRTRLPADVYIKVKKLDKTKPGAGQP
jgi:transcriptional regulator with XRE-family HTH domain